MAQQEVSGKTQEEVDKMREEYKGSSASEWYDFDVRYCLFKIPFQPEDYNGPDRYCSKTANGKKNGFYRCRYHEDRGALMKENLTKGNPKHYMYATDEYLMENLEPDEIELYDKILKWAEIYGIDEEDDPAAYDDLKLLAKQRVREVKASKYLFDEGEIVENFIRDEEGQIVLDDDGNPKTEDDTNPISEEYRRLVGLIQSLKKDLIISRRERAKAEDREVASESAQKTSEAMRELVKDDEKKFDVDEYDSEKE